MESINNPLIPSIISLIATLVGAVIGAIFGVIIPNYLRTKSEYKSFRRGKLELLYDDINNWFINSYSNIVLNFYFVFDKKIDWNGYLDMINNSNKEKVFFKSEIIISLYFKELESDFINLTKANQTITKYINNDIKKAYLAGNDILIFKSDFHEKSIETAALAEKLKNHIKDIAKRI
jgi:gas vesicle protein